MDTLQIPEIPDLACNLLEQERDWKTFLFLLGYGSNGLPN